MTSGGDGDGDVEDTAIPVPYRPYQNRDDGLSCAAKRYLGYQNLDNGVRALGALNTDYHNPWCVRGALNTDYHNPCCVRGAPNTDHQNLMIREECSE